MNFASENPAPEEPHQPSPEAGGCAETLAQASNPHLVIIDDSRSVLAQLAAMVTAMNIGRIKTFNNPLEAMSLLAGLQPELVLVDYEMPGMDGIAFIRWMRGEPALRDTPVVMITGFDGPEILEAALQAGANDFIRKPVDPFELRPRLHNLLKLSRAQSELRRRAETLASDVAIATEAIRARENEIIFRLARAIEYRDSDTGAHICRIATYSALMGRALGLTSHDCDILELAAPLHDVGKIALRDAILLKSGTLTTEERTEMQQHTIQGHHILKDSSARVLQVAAEIALCHHERWDGTGYPNKLKGADIPLVARIVAVADVFDALTTERPYKRAWPLNVARRFLTENSGSQFDPDCVAAFLTCWPGMEKAWINSRSQSRQTLAAG